MKPDHIAAALDDLLRPLGFKQSRFGRPGGVGMGAWFVEFQADEFVVAVGQDRSGEMPHVEVGSKVRRKPRAHMRGPWSLSHLRGFRSGSPDHYLFSSVDEQLEWFKDHLDDLLDSTFLNSDDLNTWAVKASQRMFGGSK